VESNASVIAPGRRLGKNAPRIDARTLRMTKYVKKAVVKAPPKTQNRLGRVIKHLGKFDVYENDVLGDCTCAAAGHSDVVMKVWGQKTDPIVTAADVVAWYSKYCGYVAGNAGTDQGGDMLTVAKGLRHDGVIWAFVALDPTNDVQMKRAIDLFGGVYSGAMLPVSAQSEKIWTRTEGNGSELGSWGGHAFWTGAYTTKLWQIVTWGDLQSMTYAWRKRYMDEAYAFVDKDWIRANGKTVKGVNLEQLEADLLAVTA
jgi:hypothetical protein